MHRRKDLLSAIHQLFLPAAKAMGRLFKIPPFEFSGNATVPVRIIDDSQVANKICCSLSSYAPQSGSGLAVTAKSHGLHGLKHRSRGQSPNLSSILLQAGDAFIYWRRICFGGPSWCVVCCGEWWVWPLCLGVALRVRRSAMSAPTPKSS